MNRNNKKMFIRAISFLSVACVVLTVSTVVYANRAQKYKFATQIVYERALAELCESLDNITVSLQKGTYCSTGRMLSEIGNDLNRQATSAKVSLSQLTDKTVPSDEMYKFLSLRTRTGSAFPKSRKRALLRYMNILRASAKISIKSETELIREILRSLKTKVPCLMLRQSTARAFCSQ